MHREGTRTISAARLCFVLLAACVPASMLPLVLLPDAVGEYLRAHLPALYRLYANIAPGYPGWAEYFAVQTLAAALAVCGAWHLLSTRSRPRLRRPHAFALLVGAYALWAAASTLWSVWPYGTRAWVIRELPFYFLAVVAMLACRAERRWLTLARVFLVSVVIQAAVTAVVLLSVAIPHGRSLTVAFLQYPLFYQNKNFSCAILLTGAYVAVGLALRRAIAARRDGAASGRLALVAVGALSAVALVGFVFVAAGALAGWVALAVSAPAYALCVLPVRHKGIVMGAAAGVALLALVSVLAVGGLRERAMAWALNPKNTANLRVIDWTAGARAFSRRPVIGWGVDTWAAIFPTFQPPLASRMPQTATTRPEHPHNEFVRVTCDLGIVGLLLYAGILGWAFTVSYRALRDRPLETRLVGYALWAGAVAFLVQTLFGRAPSGWCFSANYWLLLGVLASSAWWREPALTEEPKAEMRPLGWGLLAVAAAVVLWAWWSWGVGGYRSMVRLRRAEEANQWLAKHPDSPIPGLQRLQENLELARPRSLHPATILYYDYLVGGTLVRLGQWQAGARYLEESVGRWAPGMLKTDLMLAACYGNLGRPELAADHSRRYVLENPYKLEGYTYLARFDLPAAASLLHEQLYEREGLGDARKAMALLEFYATLGTWDNVRTVVRDACRANSLVPDGVVRMLADRLRESGQQEALKGLEAAFPGTFSPPTKQQGQPAGRP